MIFKVLIIGLGQIGMGYDLHLDSSEYIYSHARAFSEHPDFQLLAGVDPDDQRCQNFEEIYGCPAFTDLEAAIHNLLPEIIVIALPTKLHGDVLRRLLVLPSIKLVLCEKPLSYDAEEARAMVEACEAKGVLLYVNYIRRSDPGMIEIKRRIDSDEIVSPIKGVVWYSKGFLHNGSHFFNLMEYWLGSMQGFTLISKGRVYEGDDPEPDVQVVFERGEITFMSAWEEAFSHYTMELLSPSGRLRCEQGGRQIQWQPICRDLHMRNYMKLDSEPIEIAADMNRYQWNVVEALSACLAGQDVLLCSGADALHTLEGMNEILEEIANDKK